MARTMTYTAPQAERAYCSPASASILQVNADYLGVSGCQVQDDCGVCEDVASRRYQPEEKLCCAARY